MRIFGRKEKIVVKSGLFSQVEKQNLPESQFHACSLVELLHAEKPLMFTCSMQITPATTLLTEGSWNTLYFSALPCIIRPAERNSNLEVYILSRPV